MTRKQTIIALSHSGNKGKTETLRKLAELLLDSKDFDKVEVLYNSYKNDYQIEPKWDFRIIFKIYIGKMTFIVVIETQGDPKTNLQERLIQIQDAFHPDIIYCSTRTRGETVWAVDHLWKNFNYETIWTTTYQIVGEKRQAVVNDLKAHQLLQLARSLELMS